MTKLDVLLVAALAAAGCGKDDGKPAPPAEPATPPAATPPAATPPPPPPPAAPQPIRIEGVGLATPESALFDMNTDSIYVSNVNGSPFDKDGNGFISKLSAADGKVIELKWIDGAADDVTLNAPKGLDLFLDTLYVTDIDVVRMFDVKTGKPKGEIAVKGATFLNDLTHMAGVLYVSDSGLKQAKDGSFAPSGTDAVYAIDQDRNVTVVASGPELARPNGLEYADMLYMVGFGGVAISSVNKIAVSHKADLPTGGLDGIAVINEDEVFVSSWECNCIYKGPVRGPYVVVIEDVESPADIAWDPRHKRLMIPLFQKDTLVLYPMP